MGKLKTTVSRKQSIRTEFATWGNLGGFISLFVLLFFKGLFYFVCVRERTHVSASGEGAEREREGERESHADSSPPMRSGARCGARAHEPGDHDLS